MEKKLKLTKKAIHLNLTKNRLIYNFNPNYIFQFAEFSRVVSSFKYFEDCYNFKNSLEREIKPLFPNSEVRKFKRKHDADKSGKSIVDRYDIEIDSGGMVIIKCSDWSDEMPSVDKLTVGIISEELLDFVENEAYN